MKTKLLHEAAGKRTFAVILQTDDEAMRCLMEFAEKEGIGGAQVTAIGALSRARLDDGATGLHVRYGGLGQVEHGVDVDPESQLPLFVRDVLDVLEAGLVSGVVDENVDAAEFGERLVDDGLAVVGPLDVAAHEHGLAAIRFDQLLCRARILILFKVSNQNVGAFSA